MEKREDKKKNGLENVCYNFFTGGGGGLDPMETNFAAKEKGNGARGK